MSNIWTPGVEIVDSYLRNNLVRYDEGEFGAGMIGFAPELEYPANTVGRALAALLADFQTVVQVVQDGYVNIEHFGAVGDGVTDCTEAFQAALAAGDKILIPPAEVGYLITDSITIPRDGIRIMGVSRFRSKILVAANGGIGIIIPAGRKEVSLEHFCIGRAVVPTPSGIGISTAGYTEDIRLVQLVLENHGDALQLRDGWKSIVDNCLMLNNYNGLKIIPGSSVFAAWDVYRCFSSYNRGYGFTIDVAEQELGARTLGEFLSCYALYNGLGGLSVVGNAETPLESIRILGGAYSYNGNNNIMLDTYGSRHRITSVSVTGAGSTQTGPQEDQEAPSLAGNGIRVTGNNKDVNILGCLASENAYSGIHCTAASAVIVGNTCNNNGRNSGATAAVRSGIRVETGNHTVVGNSCSNTDPSLTQARGVQVITAGAKSRIYGNVCENVNNDLVIGEVPASQVTLLTVGTSPWTHTAGPLPETITIHGGVVSAVRINNQANLAYYAASGLTVRLNPGQTLQLTYTTLPTVVRNYEY